MRKSQKFIIDIVPLTRIPLDRNQSFSYLFEQRLPEGTLVSVPLFRRNVEGIVIGSRTDFERLGNIELKKIEKVIEESFLDNRQLQLAEFLSEYYFSPLGIILKSFVPKRMKARSKSPVKTEKEKSKKIVLTKEQETAANQICKIHSKFEIRNSKFLLYGPSASGKTEVYLKAISKIRERNPQSQFLVLLPELTLTPQAVERYGAHFKKNELAVISSDLTKGQFYANWQKIKSGQSKLIIGTRMAVFSPFRKLGLIVVDEEQDISFKQWDMNPRYDARWAGERLAELHDCPIVLGSATPRIEDYHKAARKELRLLKLPPLDLRGRLPQPETLIIDMKKERWEKNKTPISKKLKGEIALALRNKAQTILFINRQGMSAFSVCEDCKEVLRCPKCDRALVYSDRGTHQCLHCAFQTSAFPRCTKCGGLSFRNIGLGTQKIEKEIRTLFPGARILRADNQTTATRNSQEKIYQDFRDKKFDILVGTQMISKGWDLRNVALVGIIDADNLLTWPDFSTNEKAFQNIVQVSGRTGRTGSIFSGTVILQTFHPENPIFRFAKENAFQDFFEAEMKERRQLKLPPFHQLIKLTFQDYSASRAAKEAQKIYRQLKKLPLLSVSLPHAPFLPKIRGRYRQQIILKLNRSDRTKIKKIISHLDNHWIVDVDPISIF